MKEVRKKLTPKPVENGERFHRVVAHPLKPGDYWKAYQIEEVVAEGSKVISRQFLGKPDTKQQILAEMEVLMVPDA